MGTDFMPFINLLLKHKISNIELLPVTKLGSTSFLLQFNNMQESKAFYEDFEIEEGFYIAQVNESYDLVVIFN